MSRFDPMDFVDSRSPKGLRVTQPVADPKGASLIYPDLPCFLADGHRFVYHSSEGPAICEPGVRSRSWLIFKDGRRPPFVVSHDGRFLFYSEADPKKGDRLAIFRKDLETGREEKVFEAKGKLPGTRLDAARFCPATASSDNRRVAGSMFLGDGKTKNAPFGILSLDLETGKACLVGAHRDFLNPHLRYCASPDPDGSHDLMIQMNHGARTDETGKVIRLLGPPSDGGVDIHVLRDDGTNWRDLPWGRDGKESVIGHQVWRGATRSAATVMLENLDNSYGWADGSRQEVLAGWPAKASPRAHQGRLTPGGRRVWLSKGFPNPRFCHLCCDRSGLGFTFDTFPIFDGRRAGMQIWAGFGKTQTSPLSFRYLVNSRITFSGTGGYHAHPVIAPDGGRIFFNSMASGVRQFYMVTGY